ncbi:aldo/keto reductase [Gryllotalpicola protaetiae]|uniref:Aldo/keto reductase n=1 Tax=Gryllotalpicola protaetiae TaxID=2419771 RepID=A0A387BYX1_9MICO|nr:aldo/keto reductase [Gryllotalpicola protaetiae]AYG03531.1 aldo/keto reductase [Gryllotalpicola protaetiae]
MASPESPVPTLALNDGASIPQLGFGVFRVDPVETARIVADALEVGYRHIDTAAMYRNEDGVGRAIASSGIPRDELFVTTKFPNNGSGSAADALRHSLDQLGLDRVDLYLIHWPRPKLGTALTAWQDLIELQREGLAASIGVSNYRLEDLELIIGETGMTPAVNQIELHIEFQQRPLKEYHAAHGIATESWYPLGGGEISSAPALLEVAQAHGVTPAQAILRWQLQTGNIVIPKSNRRERMAENLDVFGFELSAGELDALGAVDQGASGRRGGDPNVL